MKYLPALLEKILPATSQKDPVVAPAGSVLRVRLDQALDTERSRPGDRFSNAADSPVVVNGNQVLSRGTIVRGHVLNARASGRLERPAVLSLTLDSCLLDGRILSLSTETIARVSGRHHERHGRDASGAAAGTVGAVVNGKQKVSMLAESIAGFTLRSALVV